jgi:hypothetical protein
LSMLLNHSINPSALAASRRASGVMGPPSSHCFASAIDPRSFVVAVDEVDDERGLNCSGVNAGLLCWRLMFASRHIRLAVWSHSFRRLASTM